MRNVKVESEINLPIKEVWKLLTDIKTYPRYVKFVKQVYINEQLAPGTYWYDKTTILFFPLKIRHQVKSLEQEKQIIFLVNTPFGGEMLQSFTMERFSAGTKVNGVISFELGKKILDFLLGGLLEARLRDMLESTLLRIKSEKL